MAVNRNKASKSAEYTVSYSGMRGVDFSTIDGMTKRYRFSHLENMYKDYSGDGDGIIESVPGFRKLVGLGKRIHSIYSYKDISDNLYYVVHAGGHLYRFSDSNKDALTTPSPILTANNRKSHGFTFGGHLYILDGRNIIKVDKNNSVSAILDGGYSAPYIPTTYYNGVEYEQRNLLTEKFYERYVVTSAGDLAVGTEGLIYKILSEEEATVGVSGIDSSVGGVIYVPAHVSIGGSRYKVTEISSYAFYSNQRITAVTLPDTVKRIGRYAFGHCPMLARVICRSSIEAIDGEAFFGCTSLSKLQLGTSLKRIGKDAFKSCTALTELDYEGSEEDFSKIESESDLSIFTVNCDVAFNTLVIEVPIYSPAKAIERVTLDGVTVTFSTKIVNSLSTAITITSLDRSSLDGKEIEILGTSSPLEFTANSVGTNFIAESEGTISGRDAIVGCTVCECFDGRVFLSGNPKLPNTVFYSSRDNTGRNNPTYFGILNYFNDGTGGYTVSSLLATGDSLAVFKSGDDGGGSIYYHTPKETGVDLLPKIYPVSYIHSGVSAIGESISFFDDPLFLSPLGLTALDKRMINLERSISVRSSNVNPRLLRESLKNATMAKWCGYLVLQAGDHIYLADSRNTYTNTEGKTEYEWYYLSGIGTYREETTVFKYSEEAKEGYSVHPTKANKEVDSTVYLTMDQNNEAIYFTKENGTKYAAYTDGEARGGIFSPATCVFATENDLLFFGTESGDICLFNNDKRGVAPDFLKAQSDFNEEEYKSFYGNEIHPYFYNFDKHAPRYALKTV